MIFIIVDSYGNLKNIPENPYFYGHPWIRFLLYIPIACFHGKHRGRVCFRTYRKRTLVPFKKLYSPVVNTASGLLL